MRDTTDRAHPAPARVWSQVPATVGLLVGFTAWGVAQAFGAESTYLVSRYVGRQDADTMAFASVALTLVGAAVLLARHRRPVLVAALVAVLAASSLLVAGATNGYELALAAALCAVAAVRPPRTTWVVAVGVALPVLVVARVAPLASLVGTLAAGSTPGDTDAVPRLRLPGVLGDVLPPWWLVTALPVVVLAAVGVASGMLLRTARLRTAALAEAAAARAAEGEQRARVAQADERARVAREMHDVIAHSITVMIALGGGAAAMLDRSPDQARRALDELVDTGRGALVDVRRILGVLHAAQDGPGAADDGTGGADAVTVTAPLAPQPGIADLGRLVERFRTAGLPVRCVGLAAGPRGSGVPGGADGVGEPAAGGRPEEPDGSGALDASDAPGPSGASDASGPSGASDTLDAHVQLAVYRVVQESLTNVLRHGAATESVEVAVHRVPGAVEVVVTDRGGVAPAAPQPAGPATGTSGRGIIGMRARVTAFGGTLEAGPHGPGWRVRAHLPLSAPGAPGGTTPLPPHREA